MENYKILSLTSCCCLVVSTALFIMAITTNGWLVGESEFNSHNILRSPKLIQQLLNTGGLGKDDLAGVSDAFDGVKLRESFDFGLKIFCFQIMLDLPKYHGKKCFEIKQLNKASSKRIPQENASSVRIPQVEIDYLNSFEKTFNCMIAALIFGGLATIASFTKMLLGKLKRQHLLLYAAIGLCSCGAIAGAAAIGVAVQRLNYDEFVSKIMERTGLYSSFQVTLMKIISQTTIMKGGKGYSFVLVCLGEVFLIVAILLQVIEYCYTRRVADPYEQGYTLETV